jgi:hypothetical protein
VKKKEVTVITGSKYSINRRSSSLICLLTLFGMALAVSTAHADPGWKVVGDGNGIIEGQTYSFYNIDQGLYLKWKDRKPGANLAWDGQPNNRMKVKRTKAGGSGPLKCGEPFYLQIDKSYVGYTKQPTGMNLTTNPTPKDDSSTSTWTWDFSNSTCSAGDVVPLNTPLTWKRAVGKDPIEGCDRLHGVNLCWSSDIKRINGKNYNGTEWKKIYDAVETGVKLYTGK